MYVVGQSQSGRVLQRDPLVVLHGTEGRGAVPLALYVLAVVLVVLPVLFLAVMTAVVDLVASGTERKVIAFGAERETPVGPRAIRVVTLSRRRTSFIRGGGSWFTRRRTLGRRGTGFTGRRAGLVRRGTGLVRHRVRRNVRFI